MSADLRVSYVDGSGSLDVTLISSWRRGEIAMVMSASSGPKDYMKNMICAAFDQVPGIDRIALVRSHGPLFALMHTAQGWFDAAARQVRISKCLDSVLEPGL